MNSDCDPLVIKLRNENTRLREMLRECAEKFGKFYACGFTVGDIRDASKLKERIEQVLKGTK